MDNRLILLHCSLVDGFGPAALTKIVNYLKTNGSNMLDSIYSLKEHDFERAGLSKDISKKLVNELLDEKILETELDLMQKFGIQLLTILDTDSSFGFPDLLKNIYLPPLVLYVKGENLNSFAKTVSIVGSRKCDNYGSRSIDLLLPDLVRYGWTTISGGAYGIDTLVHQKTVNAGGKTVAVLGSGLLNIYPASNKKLFNTIAEGNGSLVSPFPLKMSPLAGNFPARNRIIAGLSQSCLVIQAAQKSGALITARFALDQGKDVAAIPGPIDNELSVGCHELIRQGAACITSSNQLLEFLHEEVHADSFKKFHDQDNKDSSKEICKETKTQSIDEQILLLCKNPMSFDELLLNTNLSFSNLNNKLLELQLNGQISQNCFGLWQAIS